MLAEFSQKGGLKKKMEKRIELVTTFEGIPRHEIIKNLKALREEFGNHTLISGMAAPVALILLDVCNALELNQEEKTEVLGQEVVDALNEWVDCRIWVLAKEEP